MQDKKTLFTFLGILLGTILLITVFTALASQPAKPVNVEVGTSFFAGPNDAKVTVVEFSDFECPACEAFATGILPTLKKEYKDKVKFVYKFFPLYEIHKLANLSSQSAYCSGKQGKFWEYHDILMSKSAEWATNEAKFIDYARQLKLDEKEFQACQNSDEAKTTVMAERQQGEKLGINSTPTFFVNGEKVLGAQSVEVWRDLLNKKLNQ